MDPLTQIPETDTANDTVALIRDVFKEKLESETFPADLAENLRVNCINDSLNIKEVAKLYLTAYRSFDEESQNIRYAATDLLQRHSEYIFKKYNEDKNNYLKEVMKLKSCDIFYILCESDKLRYGLIEKSDLYPDIIFVLTPHYTDVQTVSLQRMRKLSRNHHLSILNVLCCYFLSIFIRIKEIKEPQVQPTLPVSSSFKLEPTYIEFKNYDLNVDYKHPIKILNNSTQLQKIAIRSRPKCPWLRLNFEGFHELAPGMCATGSITFSAKYYAIVEDLILFNNRKGEKLSITIKCFRDPPKLFVYVLKSINYPQVSFSTRPGSYNFSLRRQYAVNDTIDCGTCFATEHILLSLIISNQGHKAKFFWLSEDDFFKQYLKVVSTSLELSVENFWIYPTYFESIPGHICEISIIFQPLHCGLFAHALYLMCDNNKYRRIDIIGDAICFNKRLITVEIPDIKKNLETTKGHCILVGHLIQGDSSNITLSITNQSPLFLKYAFEFSPKNVSADMSEWIQTVNDAPEYLIPYSTADVRFELKCPEDVLEGYYNTKLSLFIKDVPIASLENDEKFIINTNGKSISETTEKLSNVDVLITEVEIACYAVHFKTSEIEMIETCKKCGEPDCKCITCHSSIRLCDVRFNKSILDLGILPVGVNVEKEISIKNIGSIEVNWHIIEMIYKIDQSPYASILKNTNLSLDRGTVKLNQEIKLNYTVIDQPAGRYVSILILLSLMKNDNINSAVAEEICLVTYEVIEMDIAIKTDNSDNAILCPLQMLYIGVPITLNFKIHNYSLIGGCFYFLPPYGSDTDKAQIEISPQSGEIKAGCTIPLTLKLTCYGLGILESIFIPCFISKYQPLIILRLLCVVDCVHVFFYIPTHFNNFTKILWPPNVIYEYNAAWSDYCLCGEGSVENTIQHIQSEHESYLENKSDESLESIRKTKEPDSTVNDNETSTILLSCLNTDDSEIFLQETVMEVKNVATKNPIRVTFYFENVTPKSSRYSVQSVNFSAKTNKIQAYLGPKYLKTETLWESMLGEHGIVVQPEMETGYMRPHELASINIWIYAKTWGVYIEEIIVDIENISAFSFSLVVQAVGCPLQLPMAINAITKYPTIRLGSFVMNSASSTKEVCIDNNSSIDVEVIWHTFDMSDEKKSGFNLLCDVLSSSQHLLDLNFTDDFFGNECSNYIEVEPRRWTINNGSLINLPVVFYPERTPCKDEKYSLKMFLVGRVYPNESFRTKSNYYYRKPTTLIIEISATLELPNILIELDYPVLSVYANEIAIQRKTDYNINCSLRNPTLATVYLKLKCIDPFKLHSCSFKVDPGKCLQITLPIVLSYEQIIEWAKLIYSGMEHIHTSTPSSTSPLLEEPDLDELMKAGDIAETQNKMLTLNRILNFQYEGGFQKLLPVSINIFYPNVSVKPNHIKCGYVVIGRTVKTIITIYNLTGCAVLFEIYKSVSTSEIFVTPSSGEIEKSVGMNHSFTNISIFFTPLDCKIYHESIRIMTNIPQYYIDIPIKGTGTVNERFD